MDTIYLFYFMVTIFSLVSAYRKPNIIFIVADDLGWNDVGWRNPEIKTPNLDRLAKNGVILNSSYVSPTCTPSRNSILTGVYPFRVGLQHSSLLPQDTRHLSLDTPTLPERLKHLGYSTHMIGKWHLGFCDWKHTPVHRGFDSFLGFLNGGQDYYKHKKENTYDFWLNKTVYYPPKGEYSTKTFTRRAVDLFRQHKGKKNPMYLYLSYQAVHTPLQVPKKYERIYKHVTNKDRRTYNGMVTAMDQSVGTILSALRKYKMLGNTIIVFTTDNGGAANIAGSNLPLRGSKTTLWEGGTRGVGFVYSKRLFKRKYVHEGLFHAVDWVPTLLAAAGGKQDKKLDGINQWPMLRGGKPSRRNGFVYSISETSAAIRIGDYKLIVGSPGIYNQWFTMPKTKSFCNSGEVAEDIFLYDNLNNAVRNIKSYISWFGSTLPGYSYWRHYKRLHALQKCKQKAKKERQKWVFPKFLLYNIKEDPTETKNLAGSKPVIFRKLKSRLERYWKRAKIFPNQSTFSDNTGKVNEVWTPGWC
ncbi:arylsulfatase I-like [Mytilus galloprovincialis]|uniref:arylsulfatase I-like n=1 Tax=Mytilus galloprovincialis TaxID=29158 RepID=UPI003F7BFAC5